MDSSQIEEQGSTPETGRCLFKPTIKQKWRHACIHQIFEEKAREYPDAIAITFGDRQLTYSELNARANQVAHRLRRMGVGPEIPVALCLDRSLDMIVAILGVLKAGGAYVPIDLAYPKERAGFMLEDSRAPVLLTQECQLASLPPHSAKAVCLDSDWASVAKESTENLFVNVSSDNVAYIIYTSGSTGKPKGVLVTHRNVVRLFTQTEHWYGFGPHDVWTLFHSYAFDFSVWEIWGALFYGGRLVVVPYLLSRAPGPFYELLARERVTVLNQTPSAFRQLIWAGQAVASKQNLSLRYIIFGGEALELQSLKPWFDQHGDECPRLVNMYGITETTVHVTYRLITMADLKNGLGSVIGVPIPDLQLHLLDENLKPTATGMPGEIYVGGGGVARGYLNRPELTAERFISNPFSGSAGGKLYRSGDLARYLSNGELEYLGRVDDQVKIRGFRIELGEIESALNRHPAIRESVVSAREGSNGEKRLVAHIVANSSQQPSITELRQFLAQEVPEYMIPSAFVFLDSLPLTPNGKMDRRALPLPDHDRPQIRAEFIAPRNPTEQLLANAWREVLELEEVGVRDNFFDLGGDSIRSIAVLSKLQQCELTFSIEHLFRHPTIEELAQFVESANGKLPLETGLFSLISSEDRAKLPADVEDAYPMIKLQVGMFYFNELNPISAVYHDVFSFRIHSHFDREKLEAAINCVVERHSVLRTSFHLSGYSEPMQLVHKAVQVPFTLEDLRQSPPKEQTARLVEWIEIEKRNPFDRTVAPLIRFHVQLQSDRAFQFIVSFHHVYLDGWSLAALLTEILQEYVAALGNRPEKIPAPRICYRDFVALEKETVSDEITRNFWMEKIRDAQVQMLPRWPKAMCAGGHEQVRGPEIEFDRAVLDGLKSLARHAGVPLKTVLLAAHQRVMGFLYGQTDVMSGLVCNGRPEEMDGEKLIGLFLNTLPLRQPLTGGTWVDLVKQTFSAEQDIMPHRRFPLAEIQQLNGGQPLFEAAFDFVHFHVYKNLQGYRDMGFMEGHYFEANNLTMLTTFMLDVTSTQLQMHFDYDPNALCPEQIQTMCGHYVNTLKAMAANPDQRYEQFSLLSENEREQILVQWNSTAADYPRHQCIHERFEAQAEKTPDAVALVFEDQALTYRELNQRANRLANLLHKLGVGTGTLVGLFVDRSMDMVVGLLGILKSGGAYVPLDPTYPMDRLAQMICDAQLSVIVTQETLVSSLASFPTGLVTLDDAKHFSTEFKIKHPRRGSSDSLAYVIYTSGSTGQPKGVQIEHRSVVNLLTSVARTTGISADDSLLAVTTFSFDIAALEIFLPLITGGKLIVSSREVTADGLQLKSLLESAQPTVMQATPATWRLLIGAGWQGSKNLKIFCGGEALTRNLADQLLDRAVEVWNLYGPTETTIWSTACKVEKGEHGISIGRPLANTTILILDQNAALVPVGVVGELHIGGDGLARGYLHREKLTLEKFIANPFVNGARLYKTGDLARYLPDGTIECLGRIDHQVKIRGHRIELGEIEAALRQNSSVKEALVMAREDGFENKNLVAYVVPQGEAPSVSDLRDFLKTKLPDYMLPSACVFLSAFPLTPNGKLDRKALPAPNQNRPELRKQFVAPRTPLEQDIAGVWREIFKIDQVGAEDSFFELGGHSLNAVQMIVRIREKLGIELPLKILFEAPTVSTLAHVALTTLLDHEMSGALEGI